MHASNGKMLYVGILLAALLLVSAAAYAVAPICPHVIGWNSQINTWAQGAPWIKVIFSGDITPAKAIGSKVFYRPWDADSTNHDDWCLPSSLTGSQYADLVWARISGLANKPDAVSYRNEFNWDDPTCSKRTCAEFINYYNRLRALGYTGKIIFGSFSVGSVDSAIWDDVDLRAATDKADGVETHEYFDFTVDCCSPWLAYRHRDLAINAHPDHLGNKEWYIGEFGSDYVCGHCTDCDDPLCRVGWLDDNKLTADQYITQLGIYSQNVHPNVVAVFLFQQGASNWAQFEVMGTPVADWMHNSWAQRGTINGNVKTSGGANLSGATVATNTGGYTTTTDASGNYTLSSVIPGTYNVTASKSGYTSQTQSNKTVTANQTTVVSFTLTPNTGTITGNVKNSSAQNISGATVSTNTGGYTTTTDASGNYTLSNVAAGTYNVSASKSGYNTGTNNNVSVTANTTTTSNFTLTTAPTGTNILPNAVTYLECGHNNTDQRGKYICDGNTSTKWCCLHNGISTAGDHWIAFDLGSNATVNSFVVKHASMGGESTALNTKTFYIESASSMMGPWTQEFYVDNASTVASNTFTYGTAKSLRYIRLRVTKPNPSTDWAVRLPEFEVWGTAGTAQAVKIESENYDRFYGAVEGTEYHDSDTSNTGTQYRNQGVDIETCSEGTYNVGWMTVGEWLLFPWQAMTTTYTPTIRYAAATAGACRIYVDGVDKTGSISLPATGGYQVWSTKTVSAITVTTGWHDIKFQMEGSNFNVNYFTLTPGGTPTTGTITGNVKSGGANLSGATVSTNTGGYTTTTNASGNYTLSNVTAGTYNVTASKSGYNPSTNNNVTVTANQTTTSNFTLTTSGAIATQDFETLPTWNSSFDAAWGSAATWAIVAGGQSGNFLQVSRASQGSSSKVLVYTVPTNTNVTVSVYMKCPSYANSYWMESACKLGNYSASDFDANSGTWTYIKKFADNGTNGNGNVWTQYSVSINTGSNTTISVGYKHGSSGYTGPTVGWDTFRIQ